MGKMMSRAFFVIIRIITNLTKEPFSQMAIVSVTTPQKTLGNAGLRRRGNITALFMPAQSARRCGAQNELLLSIFAGQPTVASCMKSCFAIKRCSAYNGVCVSNHRS